MAGFAIRDEMNGIAPAPGKVWFWELEEAVIDADRCIQCGTCVAACPSDSIGIGDDDLPELVKMCTGCSLCWDFCPRGGLRYETTWPPLSREADDTGDRGWGQAAWKITGDQPGTGPENEPAVGRGRVEAEWTARVRTDAGADDGPREGSHRLDESVRRKVQDGGVVTALLIALLEVGEIDGAVAARQDPDQTWKGVPFVATTPEEVIDTAGSFYNQTMGLGHLDLKGYDLPPDPRLVVVGTPCEVQGIRAMQTRPWTRWGASKVDSVVLTVALLCTKSFDYEALMRREIADQRGIDLTTVGRVDVIRGKLIVEDTHGATLVSEPIKDFHGAALKGCDECADFVGYGADISVGSVGSPDGWSSVLVRTEAGQRALAHAEDLIEHRPIDDPGRVDKLQAMDRRIALESIRRPLDPDAPMFIDFAHHVEAYADSDRAPVRRGR